MTKVATAEARSQAGIYGAQAQAILTIATQNGSNIKDLSDRLDLGKSGLTTLVRRLEDQDLIRRENDPKDGRASILNLTAKGAQAHGHVTKMVAGLDRKLVDGFTNGEIKVIDRFLAQASRLK